MSIAPGAPTIIHLSLAGPLRDQVEALPLFAAAPRQASDERLAFHDTPKLALRRRGLVLSRREEDGLWQASGVVTARLSAGKRLRAPQRAQLAGGDDNLAALIDRSRMLFESRERRRGYRLELEDRSLVRASFVEGRVEAGRRRAALDLIEVTVEEGPAGPAYRLATRLVEEHGARLAPEAAPEIGYRLAAGGAARPMPGADPTLPAEIRLGPAIAWTMGEALHHFVANIPASAEGDPEGIHQMRVALRRLRTLLVLFAPVLEPFARSRFNGALREIATTLGQARDWDVFISESLVDAARHGLRRDAVDRLRPAAEKLQRAAHKRVRAMIEGPAPSLLVLGIAAWVAETDWQRGGADRSGERVAALLPRLLGRLAGKAATRGAGIADLSEEALHELRKSLKKLRYGAEAVRSLYPPGTVEGFLRHLRHLQAALGTINDAAVAPRLIEALAPEGEIALVPAASAFLAWNQTRSAAAHAALHGAWKEFGAAEGFWK